MSDDELAYAAGSLFGAGSDTTASAISSGWTFIAPLCSAVLAGHAGDATAGLDSLIDGPYGLQALRLQSGVFAHRFSS